MSGSTPKAAPCRTAPSGTAGRLPHGGRRPVGAGRRDLKDETGRLRGEIEALAARVAALEKRQSVLPLPTDGDIDKTLGMVERLLRGFAGIARNLDREPRDGAAPDRT